MTRYLVQYSTGLGSAEAARRAYNKAGIDDEVILLTADTRVEDPDNWRFAHEVVDRLLWGVTWHILADGRTPMQVGRDVGVIPNNRMAVCSRILKRELIRRWVNEHGNPDTDTVVLGFDWTEPHRHGASVPHWEPYPVWSPLNAEPWFTKAALMDRFRNEYGIEPPRLYAEGHSHANCGGACVRGGQAAWRRLLYASERGRRTYLEWEREEQMSMDELGRDDIAILRDRRGGESVPVSLRRFRERLEETPSLFDADDEGYCGCDPWRGAS